MRGGWYVCPCGERKCPAAFWWGPPPPPHAVHPIRRFAAAEAGATGSGSIAGRGHTDKGKTKAQRTGACTTSGMSPGWMVTDSAGGRLQRAVECRFVAAAQRFVWLRRPLPQPAHVTTYAAARAAAQGRVHATASACDLVHKDAQEPKGPTKGHRNEKSPMREWPEAWYRKDA